MHDGSDDVYITRVSETIHVTLRGRVFFNFFSSRCVRIVSVLTELTEFSPRTVFFCLFRCWWSFLLVLCEDCFGVHGFFSSRSCVRVVSVLTEFSPHIVFPDGVNGFFF